MHFFIDETRLDELSYIDVAGEGSDVMTDFFRDVIEAKYVNFSFAKVDCQLIKAFAEVVDAALACEA